MNHPNLHPSINKAISNMENAHKTINLDGLTVGDRLRIQTRNTLYTVSKVGEDAFAIRGHHEYCPGLTLCHISGCTFGGSMLAVGRLFEGGHMEFYPHEGPHTGKQIVTSPIQWIWRI